MNNRIKIFGIITLVAMLAFSLVFLSCGDSGDPSSPRDGNGDNGDDESVGPIGHTHKWAWTVVTDDESEYPTLSMQFCKECGEFTGTPRPVAILDIGPAGGIIYYINLAGFKLYQGTKVSSGNADVDHDTYTIVHYLEAAPAEPGQYRWSDLDPDFKDVGPGEFVKIPNDITVQRYSGTNQYTGYGLRNTRIIVAALNSAGESNRAAQVCLAKTTGGFNDWFLPSIDELDLIYVDENMKNDENKMKALNVGKSADGFWSSSEKIYNTGDVRGSSAYVRFPPLRDNYYKRHDFYVRAVRAF